MKVVVGVVNVDVVDLFAMTMMMFVVVVKMTIVCGVCLLLSLRCTIWFVSLATTMLLVLWLWWLKSGCTAW